ncbi:MAG TPA: hypothetical protein VFM37_09425 [Pseudonocardiaceae bacterium]|nr:hypothetical protein [Pseudonocardiaceae bacterium]
MMANSGEFAEFDTDEAAFDAMLAQAEPAELVDPPADVTSASTARDNIRFAPGLPIFIPEPTATLAGRGLTSRARRRPMVQGAQQTIEVAS